MGLRLRWRGGAALEPGDEGVLGAALRRMVCEEAFPPKRVGRLTAPCRPPHEAYTA